MSAIIRWGSDTSPHLPPPHTQKTTNTIWNLKIFTKKKIFNFVMFYFRVGDLWRHRMVGERRRKWRSWSVIIDIDLIITYKRKKNLIFNSFDNGKKLKPTEGRLENTKYFWEIFFFFIFLQQQFTKLSFSFFFLNFIY